MACLFSNSVIRREHGDPLIEELNPGDALEPEGRGTGEAPKGLPALSRLSIAHTLGRQVRAARSTTGRRWSLPLRDKSLGQESGEWGVPESARQEAEFGMGGPVSQSQGSWGWGWSQASVDSSFSGNALMVGDRKERLGVLKSNPSPLGTQPGVKERALDYESQDLVLPLPRWWFWKSYFIWVLFSMSIKRGQLHLPSSPANIKGVYNTKTRMKSS